MIERAEQAETLSSISALLAANGLPVDDLADGPAELFCVCEGITVQGAVGIERYGDVGLIRSLVVPEDGRGKGMATTLVEALEAEALRSGVRWLYLLTNSATGFFAAKAYVEVDRENVPDAIRQTRQFSSLCPGSATVMLKDLEA